MTTNIRQHDIVIFGATGFVGKLVVAHLAEHAPDDTRIALAGRNAARLADVATQANVDWPQIIVDSSDAHAMQQLAESTKVVLTLVGPYWKYGRTLVHECAKAGTHYVDLAGEVLFTHDSIERNHAIAEQTGAKIVHSCGFDSIPSDVAVRSLYDVAHTRMLETTLLVKHLRGGASGGTIDSVRAQVAAVKAHPELRRVIADRYALAAPGHHQGAFGADLRPVRFHGSWRAPFFMAPYNTRIVERSAYLSGYGDSFRYRELLNVGSGLRGLLRSFGFTAGMLGGLGVLGLSTSVKPIAKWLDKKLPAPGTGPSEEERAKGRFTIEAYTTDTSGAHWKSTVSLEQDPGYDGTAMMISSCALALVYDELPAVAGVLTPTVALGDALIKRLQAGGMQIKAGAE